MTFGTVIVKSGRRGSPSWSVALLDVGDDRKLRVAYLGQRKQRCSLHLDRQHTFVAVLIELLTEAQQPKVSRF